MHYNNKHHLSKEEREYIRKLSEEQEEFLAKLEEARKEFDMVSSEMEDMKGSVDNIDNQIKEKETGINKTIVDSYFALVSIQEYFIDQEIKDLILTSKLDLVKSAIENLEKNFEGIIK